MSYQVFLLEVEVGYFIGEDFSGLALIERLKMLNRYYKEKNDAQPVSNGKGKGGKGSVFCK